MILLLSLDRAPLEPAVSLSKVLIVLYLLMSTAPATPMDPPCSKIRQIVSADSRLHVSYMPELPAGASPVSHCSSYTSLIN
jgi:hypothetical protein